MTTSLKPEAFVLSRRIPAASALAVEPGQVVEPETIIAEGYLDRTVLRLPPGDNFEILKRTGDPVKKGETVAVMEEMLGFGLRELVSPCDGIVESVNSQRTAMVLTGADSQIRALAAGKVAGVEPGEVRLALRGYRFAGYFGLGAPASGRLVAAGELQTAGELKVLRERDLGGCVVLADSYVLPEVIPLLAAKLAAGLVCGGIDFAPLWELVRPGGPHAGGQGLPALVVLGGFGIRTIDPEVRKVLAAAEGRAAYVAGPASEKLAFAGPPYAEVVLA